MRSSQACGTAVSPRAATPEQTSHRQLFRCMAFDIRHAEYPSCRSWTPSSRCFTQVSDKCPPADLVSMIKAFNPDNLPGRLAVVVRMGAAKLRTHMPALIEAVEEARLVRTGDCSTCLKPYS
jgi:Class-II DAHP synthetase family